MLLTLPLPAFVAVVLGFLCLRHGVDRDRSLLFIVLLLACAVQALVISLAQHYGVSAARAVQPVTAILIPPLAWLAFQRAGLRAVSARRDWIHGLMPILVLMASVWVPATLDVILPLGFLGYGFAILWTLRSGSTLPKARLQSGPLPVQIWRSVGVLLMLSALSDVLIAGVLILGQGGLRPVIISVFTSFTLMGIGLLALARDADSPQDNGQDGADSEVRPQATEDDTELVGRLDDLMVRQRLYLDADLTLVRLAKRLGVPAKHLSTAINRVTSQNVPRYVNDYRIQAACSRLQEGETVTEAMLASGFNTKSNFNREFLRVTGQTPSDYQVQHSPV